MTPPTSFRVCRSATRVAGATALAAALSANAAAGRVPPPAQTPPPPSPPKPLLAETPPAYDLASGRVWRDRIMPIVEQIAGRRFAAPPALRIVDRETLLESLVDDALLQARALGARGDEPMLRMQLSLDLVMQTPALLGRYSLSDGVIELPAGNVTPLMELAGWTPDRLEPVMLLTMAHELAHALHFQEIDASAQIRAIRSPDGMKAWNATLEGFGMLVQELAAEQLQLRDVNARLVRVMALEDLDHPRAEPARLRFEQSYRAGWDFLRAQRDAGGMDRVWQVLAAPPVTFAQVREPQRYGQAVATEIDIERLFAGVGGMLGAEQWQRTTVTVDPEGVARTYGPLGTAAVRTMTESVRQAHTQVLNDRSSSPPNVCGITVMELNGAAAGPEVLEQIARIRDLQFERLRELAEGQGFVVEEDDDAIEGLEGVEGRVYRMSLRPANVGDGDPVISMTVAGARRDAFAVQLITSGSGIDAASLPKVIDTVLARAATGAAMVPVVEPDRGDPLVAVLQRVPELLDGEGWAVEWQPVDRIVAGRMTGDDLEASIALDMGFVRGQGVAVTAPAAGDRQRASVVVSLLQMSDADAASALRQPMLDGMSELVDRFRNLPGVTVEQRDEPARTLDGGATVLSRRATITLPGQAPSVTSVHVASVGPHVAHVLDVNEALGAVGLERLVTVLFDALATDR